jgi:hypothetical protein
LAIHQGSPTVLRRRLGIELRRLREAAGFTIERVAEALECSDSKISRIETGQVGATPRDVRDMLELYGIGGEQRDALISIARGAREKAWWHAFSDVPFGVPYVGLEAAAAQIRTYEALLVPGLLQTPDYARAVSRVLAPQLDPKETERRVELRIGRQVLLTLENSPILNAVIDEAVLRREVGGPEVTRRQLHRLLEASTLPTVTIQVLPFAAGEHAGMSGAFTILTFSEPADPEVVYLEHNTNDLYLQDPEEIRQYSILFDHLGNAALAPDDSRAFLADLAK